MALFNFTMVLLTALIYLLRCTYMCGFDEEPIWKIDPDEVCKGEHKTWYYIFLIFVHVYWFLDYMIRVITQKYVWKYLKSFESILEIITIGVCRRDPAV